jgi:hypothetical protein
MGQSLEICWCVKDHDNDSGGEKAVLKNLTNAFSTVNNNI